MEEHTAKHNTVHTQLLLQMQIDSNIQEMKEKLSSTQNELQATKTLLYSKQNELLATKLKLEQTMEELNHAKEDATKKENQIKFLQENIENKIENGFKLNQQITEWFAKYCSTLEQKQDQTLETIFKSLGTKQAVNQFELIEPIEINGMELKFPNANKLLQNLTHQSYEEMFDSLLKKMENGQIHHINNNQLIFKLRLPKNYAILICHRNNIASIAALNEQYVVVKNHQLVLYDNANKKNEYTIHLQILNYDINSKCSLYQRSENGEKTLLKYSVWNNINMVNYKTASNEVLFHITK